jgi:polysaccharide deacetylase family protein (PEP-CTERM system associated)
MGESVERDEGVIQAVEPLGLRAPAPGSPVGALTVDVEDWYQSCVDLDAPITERVVRNTDRVLALFDELDVKATFFVQGLVAEAFPSLVAAVAEAGHDVQSHAHTHRSLASMSRSELYDELARGKAAVEDAAGTPVSAFRAPDFSIGADNLWALELLAELGFTVDSSIFPLATGRYGIAGWEPGPHRLRLGDDRSLVEVPVAVWSWRRLRLPVAGGGYFRLGPHAVLSRALRALVRRGRPPVLYCHPYEFNPHELAEYRGKAPRAFRFQQGLGRRAFVRRLRRLSAEIPLGRLDTTLAAWGAAPVEAGVVAGG